MLLKIIVSFFVEKYSIISPINILIESWEMKT